MRRGDIHFVALGPALGSEANKVRPCVIVSNDRANDSAEYFGRGVLTVVPLTSNCAKVRSFQVFLGKEATGLPKDSKAQPEQVRSVAIERMGRRVGRLPLDLMKRLDDALRLHLDI